MTEVWKDIPGYVGLYQVSDQGRVKSLARYVVWKDREQYVRERILRPSSSGASKYPHVTLNVDGEPNTFSVHVLVMLAFVGPCPAGMQVCHNDGNHTRSLLSNLRYDTPKKNSADKPLHGTQIKGARVHTARLTALDVLQIRKLTRINSYRHIAAQFGVSKSTVTDIIHRRSWKHIP